MAHVYDELVKHLRAASTEAQRLGLGPSLAKGRVGEVLLAHHLGHTLVVGDKGADGISTDGKKYEYKVSDDDQYNFNFGQWREPAAIESYLDKKFAGYEGSYCALVAQTRIAAIVYVSLPVLRPILVAHLKGIKEKSPLQKNYAGIRSVAKVQGATWILEPT